MRLFPLTGAGLAAFIVAAVLLVYGFLQLLLLALSTNHLLDRNAPYIVVQVLVLLGLSGMELWLRWLCKQGYGPQARSYQRVPSRRRR